MKDPDAAAAEQNVILCLGEDNPAIVTRILTDLHEREHLDDAAISRLPPWELDRLDDRYGWLDDGYVTDFESQMSTTLSATRRSSGFRNVGEIGSRPLLPASGQRTWSSPKGVQPR